MSQPYVGEIRMFAGNFAPRGWALCNGQTLSIQQNTALFSILGTTYGGNGVQNFQLPNMQSRAPVHAGQGTGLSNYALGGTAGVENVQLTVPQMPIHTHVATFTPSGGGGGSATAIAVAAVQGSLPSPVGNILAQTKSGAASLDAYAPASAATGSLGGVTGGGGGGGGGTVSNAVTGGSSPVPVIQPVLAVNFIIALVGIFPSRN
jgi:microcystin-dependent protein